MSNVIELRDHRRQPVCAETEQIRLDLISIANYLDQMASGPLACWMQEMAAECRKAARRLE